MTSRWNVVCVLRNPLVMEVEESQNERRRRLATLRKENKEIHVLQRKEDSITCKRRRLEVRSPHKPGRNVCYTISN